jgi:hypothetical protein
VIGGFVNYDSNMDRNARAGHGQNGRADRKVRDGWSDDSDVKELAGPDEEREGPASR